MSDAERQIVGTIESDADIPGHFGSEDDEVAFWESREFSLKYVQAHRIPCDQSPIVRIKAKREIAARADSCAPCARYASADSAYAQQDTAC